MTFPENVNFNKFLKAEDPVRPLHNLQSTFYGKQY